MSVKQRELIKDYLHAGFSASGYFSRIEVGRTPLDSYRTPESARFLSLWRDDGQRYLVAVHADEGYRPKLDQFSSLMRDMTARNIACVSVFDYKTRQVMSVKAIKGETKNDDGNYFRQLVFYKLLLGGDQLWRMKNISTSLVFVSPDSKGRCPIVMLPVEEDDIKQIKVEIQAVIDSVWSGKIIGQYCTDSECKYCGYRKLLK